MFIPHQPLPIRAVRYLEGCAPKIGLAEKARLAATDALMKSLRYWFKVSIRGVKRLPIARNIPVNRVNPAHSFQQDRILRHHVIVRIALTTGALFNQVL